MKNRIRESLSALCDGECDELELRRVLNHVENDAEFREQWANFHLIGAAMRGESVDTVDLSKVVLTHHNLRNLGERNLALGGSKPLPPSKPGEGLVQEKEKAMLAEIISKLNDLFTGDLTDDDKLTYVGTVIKNKLLDDKDLQSQAASNTKEQFSSSPDLIPKQLDAVITSLDAHQSMSSQVVNDVSLQKRMLELLLGNLNLYEDLRAKAENAS